MGDKEKRYYWKHRSEVLARKKPYAKRYYLRHKEKENLRCKTYYRSLKKQIFEKLGNCCSNPNCPIPRDKLDVRCLQIDHVHDNGSKEHKQFKSRNNSLYLRKVLEDKEGNYQLLCAYCNWLKRYNIL